jgi:orotate phosphoribosyltransferase-like protein
MSMSPQQIASILKLRGIGWSQKEIADTIGTSQQVVAYHLKKMREESRQKGVDDVFSAALLGGLAMGAAAAGLAMLIEQLVQKD